MVTVNFKLISKGTVRLQVKEPETFENILQRCAAETSINPDECIAVRKNTTLSKTDLVQDQDEIDVFPAISGG